MGKVIVGIAILSMAFPISLFADVVWIPMPTKVGEFKEIMREKGMDLSGSDNAEGFVEDHGTKIKVVTYGTLSNKQLDDMKDAAFLAARK